MVSPSPSCCTAFSALWQERRIFLTAYVLLSLLNGPQDDKLIFLVETTIGYLSVGDPLISQNPKEFMCFICLGQILVFACIIFLEYSKCNIFIIPNSYFSPFSYACSYPFLLVCDISMGLTFTFLLSYSLFFLVFSIFI